MFFGFLKKIKTHRLKKMGLSYAVRRLIFSSPGFQADFKSFLNQPYVSRFWLLLVKSSVKAALTENADFLAGVMHLPLKLFLS